MRVDPPFRWRSSWEGGVATYAGRGEFDAPRESLSTALRRLSRGGALRITGIERTIGTPNRYASREVLLNPVRCAPGEDERVGGILLMVLLDAALHLL